MKWEFIHTGKNSGKFNMDFDLNLVQQVKAGQGFFRLYYWKPYCISLGANQSIEDIDVSACEKDGIEIVKRPTGGRAILHAEELTYSVVLPITEDVKPREIYKKISVALMSGLANYDEKLKECSLENNQPNFRDLLQTNSGVVCFASTAQNEVNYKGKKLIGSAQRKIDGKILQHGSILIGDFHKKLPHYLNIDSSEKEILTNEMFAKTTEINSILDKSVKKIKLEEVITESFFELFQ